jgi:hypothetical protein
MARRKKTEAVVEEQAEQEFFNEAAEIDTGGVPEGMPEGVEEGVSEYPESELLSGSLDENVIIPRDYSHLPINEQAALRCKDRIEASLSGYTRSLYDMALGFLEAYENDYAKLWGFDAFQTYVEVHLGLKIRFVYYMIDVGKMIRKYDIPAEQVQRIGWTKLSKITASIQEHPDEAARYLEMAENLNRTELEDSLKSEIFATPGREATPDKFRLACVFTGQEASVIQDAIGIAYGDIGQPNATLAIQHIAGEWLVQRGSAQSGVTLEDWTHHLERTFNVRLVRAESEDSIDAIITGSGATEEDDRALDDLLNSTPEEIEELTQ